jgi:hypothetical protein
METGKSETNMNYEINRVLSEKDTAPVSSDDEVIIVESENLIAIENEITTVLSNICRCKKALCILLAKIKKNELYKQIGFYTYKSYIKSKRLKISYNTALEYADIGMAFSQYAAELEMAGFTEADGMKKLCLLNKALKNHELPEVFSRLKNDSFQQFKIYCQPARAGCPEKVIEPPFEKQKNRNPENTCRWIFEETGKLYLNIKSENWELLTFNKKLLENTDSIFDYRQFMSNMIMATMDYFTNEKKNMKN